MLINWIRIHRPSTDSWATVFVGGLTWEECPKCVAFYFPNWELINGSELNPDNPEVVEWEENE